MIFGNAGVTHTPCSFFMPRILCLRTSLIIITRSSLSCPSFASSIYIYKVMKGVWPFVVIRVTNWYWIIWTPRLISSLTRISAILLTISSVGSIPIASSSSRTVLRNFWRLISTNGARCAREILWPPYCELATCAIACVAILQAVEKLWGLSIFVSLITVPFCNISAKFTRQQLCICCAK